MGSTRPFGLSTLWIAHDTGPTAKEALQAIGLPSDGDEIRIETKDDLVTVNGKVVPSSDASLVYCAHLCDPHPFREEPAERLVLQVRHAIANRLHITRQIQGLRA